MTITINPSNIGNDLFTAHASTWLLVVVLFAAGLIASLAIEVIKRKRTVKQQQDLTKKAIAWLLTTFVTVTTFAGYVFFFLQSNSSLLDSFPFLARHVPQVLGVLWFVYQLRLNKWYKLAQAKFGKKPVATTVSVVPLGSATESSTPDFVA